MKIPENRIQNVNPFHSLPLVETSELCVVMSQKIGLYKCLIFTVSARGNIFLSKRTLLFHLVPLPFVSFVLSTVTTLLI